MSSVILTNTAAGAGSIGTSPAANRVIKLDKNKLQTGGIKLLPYLDHIVVYATLGGAVATGTAWLYWDAAGDHLAIGPITLTASTNLTTTGDTNLYGAIGRWVSPASNDRADADAGCLYLALAVNANTINVAATDVELFCHDNNTYTG